MERRDRSGVQEGQSPPADEEGPEVSEEALVEPVPWTRPPAAPPRMAAVPGALGPRAWASRQAQLQVPSLSLREASTD